MTRGAGHGTTHRRAVEDAPPVRPRRGVAVGSGAVYVAGSVLTAVDPTDGERLWERRIGSNGGEFSGPAVAGDALSVAASRKTERADYLYDNDVRTFY